MLLGGIIHPRNTMKHIIAQTDQTIIFFMLKLQSVHFPNHGLKIVENKAWKTGLRCTKHNDYDKEMPFQTKRSTNALPFYLPLPSLMVGC